MTSHKENVLLTNKHMFVCDIINKNAELEFLKNNFCGIVITDISKLIDYKFARGVTIIFMAGNIEQIYDSIKDKKYKLFFAVKELSYNMIIDESKNYELITIGSVPINVHNVGILFRNFFDSTKNYFDLFNSEHNAQYLKESTKPGVAFRKGIYLTDVEETKEGIQFNLLRCSTNLDGPTDNFRATDHEIVSKVNNISKYFFKDDIELNHVLAQIYYNVVVDNKQRKAKISEHSDKTKDMPEEALIAFITFYEDYYNDTFNNEHMKQVKRSDEDSYNFLYNKTSVLTTLKFRLKDDAKECNYVKEFEVILYPNSVFLITLEMNRLYTHRIIPSILPIQHIPIRLGYVLRCSNTPAMFKDDQTYIIKKGKKDDKYIKLEPPTSEDVKELKVLYSKENRTTEVINYGDIYFSLNNGDYMKPIL
jgi:hypothetical protein